MPVSATHPQYQYALNRWRYTRDACKGQEAIKRAGERYLPEPAIDADDTEKVRYMKYLGRAYFLGVTGRTRDALIGMIFRKEPTYTMPDSMLPILENADGSGASLIQLAKEAAGEILETGRFAFLVDYPSADPNIDAETEARLGLRPIISTYPAESLINWKTDIINGRTVLTLAVLLETRNKPSDEFDTTTFEKVYRVLRLTDGVYTQQLYSEQGEAIEDEIIPLQANRQPFDHIPLHISGAQNNRADVDDSPLFDLAVLNVRHYQVTADHGENLHIHGQVTVGITSDMSFEAFKVANPNGVQWGANKGIFLGETGSLQTATAPESSSLRVALQDLRDEMVNIGARIITGQGQNETAEAARLNAASESSVLDMMVGNLGEALEAALEDCARFMGIDPDGILFQLNREFFDQKLDAQTIMSIIQLGDVGIISRSVQRDMIRTGRLEIPSGVSDEDMDSENLETGL